MLVWDFPIQAIVLSHAVVYFRFTRAAVWVSATSFLLLAIPIVFEQERFNLEQQQQQHQRQVGCYFTFSH